MEDGRPGYFIGSCPIIPHRRGGLPALPPLSVGARRSPTRPQRAFPRRVLTPRLAAATGGGVGYRKLPSRSACAGTGGASAAPPKIAPPFSLETAQGVSSLLPGGVGLVILPVFLRVVGLGCALACAASLKKCAEARRSEIARQHSSCCRRLPRRRPRFGNRYLKAAPLRHRTGAVRDVICFAGCSPATLFPSSPLRVCFRRDSRGCRC